MSSTGPIQRHVLVIDDDRAVIDDYRRVLTAPPPRKVGRMAASFFDVPSAVSTEASLDVALDCAHQGAEGIDAVAQALEKGEPYDVVFVDMRMPPGMDGRETMRRIRQIDPSLPCIVCTAFSDAGDDVLREEFGSQLVVLHKPFDPAQIRALVRDSNGRAA